MRITPFLIVVSVALIFVIPKAMKEKVQEREAQEEEVESMVSHEMREIQTLKVRYAAPNPKEAAIADIIWMRKAAEVAMDSGTPYFNVLKQEITQRFNSRYKMDLPVVHGIIQLEDDPMRAEYDAHEIESLILSNPQ